MLLAGIYLSMMESRTPFWKRGPTVEKTRSDWRSDYTY